MTGNVLTTLSRLISDLGSIISSLLRKEGRAEGHPRQTSSLERIYELYKEKSRVSSPGVFSDELAQAIVFFRIFRTKSSKKAENFIFHLNDINLPPDIGDFVEEMERKNTWHEIRSTLESSKSQDPVIQFYEEFLETHDPRKRRKRGAYYTPGRVVSFITRSLQKMITRYFNEPRGLAGKRVMIWDPAVGTGTFLKNVYERVLDGNSSAGKDELKNHLLKNVSGNEIMLSPCLISRIRLQSLLEAKGVSLEENESIPIRFENALTEQKEPPDEVQDKILIIVGNPPYSVSSANKSDFMERIMEDYKKGLGERNIQPLSDDYIKFIRYAQWKLEDHNRGIVGFVTNNSFIYKIIHRKMRANLHGFFNKIYILNLHGNANIGEKTPDGEKDENVFDIRVGIAIVFFVKDGSQSSQEVFYRDLYGTREEKLSFLKNNDVLTINFKQIHPRPPKNLFIDVDMTRELEYLQFRSTKDIFKESIIGVKTHRDKFIVEFSRERIEQKIQDLASNIPDEEIKEAYKLKDDIGTIERYRKKLRTDGIEEEKYLPYQYRLFDERILYYSPSLITRDRRNVMKHMLRYNLALVTTRLLSSPKFSHCFIADKIGDIGLLSSRTSESAYFFPLYLYDDGSKKKELNIEDDFLQHVNERYPGEEIQPHEIFAYIYGLLHSRAYRERYKELLKYEFPRVPLVKDLSTFKNISDAGKELVELHLLKNVSIDGTIKHSGEGKCILDKFQYDSRTNTLHLNANHAVEGIPPAVWKHKIGSYPVLKKWLKSRKGMEISPENIQSLVKIATSISHGFEVIQKLNEIPIVEQIVEK